MAKVAWIGMGRVGKQMALSVLRAGHSLTGHARTPSRHADAQAAGAYVTASIQAAVRGAEVVCVNVYSEDQMVDAMLGSGALAAMESGSVLAIHSTVGPFAVREIALARPDVHVLDAPFSGSAEDAWAARIALMVGGERAALERARPVFESYADHIAHVGPQGAGMMLKLVNNALFAAQINLARDAVRILDESGMNRADAIATLMRSSGASFAVQRFAAGDPDEIIASVAPYMRKDMAAAVAAGDRAGFDLRTIRLAAQSFIDS